MVERGQIYTCNVCGNIVEVRFAGGGALVCCGEPMKLMVENTVDASKEKHVPVIEAVDNGYKVKIGSIEHPMEEKHYIMWISLIADGVEHTKYLKPGDKPEAFFAVKASQVTAREYCNLHGLWVAKIIIL